MLLVVWKVIFYVSIVEDRDDKAVARLMLVEEVSATMPLETKRRKSDSAFSSANRAAGLRQGKKRRLCRTSEIRL